MKYILFLNTIILTVFLSETSFCGKITKLGALDYVYLSSICEDNEETGQFPDGWYTNAGKYLRKCENRPSFMFEGKTGFRDYFKDYLIYGGGVDIYVDPDIAEQEGITNARVNVSAPELTVICYGGHKRGRCPNSIRLKVELYMTSRANWAKDRESGGEILEPDIRIVPLDYKGIVRGHYIYRGKTKLNIVAEGIRNLDGVVGFRVKNLTPIKSGYYWFSGSNGRKCQVMLLGKCVKRGPEEKLRIRSLTKYNVFFTDTDINMEVTYY